VQSLLVEGQLSQLLQELRDLSRLEGVSVSPELIFFLMEAAQHEDVDVGERSQLQIELILRSLSPSLAKQLGKALR